MISSINIPDSLTNKYGLKSNTLHRLGKIVVLAGPNGSGKTRYLKAIKDTIDNSTKRYNSDIERKRDTLRKRFPKKDQTPPSVWGLKKSSMTTFWPEYDIVPNLIDEIQARQIGQPYNSIILNIDSCNFNEILKHLSSFLSEMSQAQAEGEHEKIRQKSQRIEKNFKRVLSFNELLSRIMNREIDYDYKEDAGIIPAIRDRIFDPNELSKGELTLLLWTIALHSTKNNFCDKYVFVDEPELNLHPDAAVQYLRYLCDDVIGNNGQLFIATHSVPIVAFAGYKSVFYVNDSSIVYSGSHITNIVDSLVGGSDGRQRLSSYLLDAPAIGEIFYNLSCIFSPTSTGPRSDDPQQKQFVEFVTNKVNIFGSLNLLDYYAGSGRFARALSDYLITHSDNINNIHYNSYTDDKYSASLELKECIKNTEQLGEITGVKTRHFSNEQQLKDLNEKFDIVLLCNVLHEIDPSKWRTAINNVYNLLDSAGFLVIMEDLLPPVGELPTWKGHIVLDQTELEILFNTPVFNLSSSSESNSRLLIVGIQKDNIKKITLNNIKKTLHSVKSNAYKKMIDIRKNNKLRTQKDGRIHAHYMAMFTNASIAIDEIEKDKRKSNLQ